MKKFLVFTLCFLAGAVFTFAQSPAAEVETLLNAATVTYAQAARFVLEAADVAEIRDPGEAFNYAAERKWLPKEVSVNDTVRFDGISLLLMRSFDIKGGIMYTLSKSKHHAYRELVYRDVIQSKSDPAMTVSGGELLFLIGRLLSEQEAGNTSQSRKDAKRVAAEQERLLQEINAQLTASGTQEISARITDQGVTINLPNIQFVVNSAELTQDGRNKLEEAAQVLRNVPERNILVGGHTALAGTAEEQQFTSLQRARAAADYLILRGVRTAGEIAVRGYGATRPLADNATEEGMAQNRRVEIIILTAEAMENLR